jgi:Tat protein secretion system quality control protein TatD with DNase activity
MSWVDAHCHLQLAAEDPGRLLARATDVDWVVVPGVDYATSKAAFGLAESFPGRVVATSGLHPHDATKWAAERDALAALAPLGVAIGEIGLDGQHLAGACRVDGLRGNRERIGPPSAHDDVGAFRGELLRASAPQAL